MSWQYREMSRTFSVLSLIFCPPHAAIQQNFILPSRNNGTSFQKILSSVNFRDKIQL